jgi:nucleotide-binding universal stress UspA family protein
MLEKILVPVDFSESSLVAVNSAAALARRFHSQITLLHVSELLVLHPLNGPLGFGITSTEAERVEHLGRCQKQLDAFGVRELVGIPVKRLLCCGDPGKLIVQRARDEKSDLILMPTHGRGTFRRFLLGSVTAKVLHDADCAVWTGAHLAETPAVTPADIHQVMCAVNFGPQSCTVVRWAAALSSELGANLTLIHAMLGNPPSLPDNMFQWHEEAYCGAEERLRRLVVDSGIQADVLVVGDGDIPKVLSAAAKDKQAGLLVIGRSCSGDMTRRLGTYIYSIICNAPCHVVSV